MKRFFGFLKNLSVSWKFIFAYFAVLIVPLIFSGVYLYLKTSDSAISQAMLVMERNLLQTRSSILQKVKLIENISGIITTEKSVLNVLDFEYEDESFRLKDYQFDISPFIQNIHGQSNLIHSIRIYTGNSIITEMIGSYYSVRKTDSPDWYAEMSAKKPVKPGWNSAHDTIGNALRDASGVPEQVFSHLSAINSPTSRSDVGQLEIEIKESLLFDMLRDPVTSRWGRVFIADTSGRIVSNNIPELYGSNVSRMGIADYSARTGINRVETVEKERAIVISVPVHEIECSIIGIFPVSNFNSEVKASIKSIIMVLLISSVFLGVIIYFITNALLSRIKKLVKAMKQVRHNNLDVSVPVGSTDEFGELALSFNHMTGRIHDLVETVYKIRLMEREAELKALEAQINPHFLYNTLATISWVARKSNAEEIMKISNSLARFYRLVLSKGGTLIYAREELDMVRAYLQIQKIRFESLFDAVYEIGEDIYGCKVVKNILQPIVENALNHGIEPKRSHGTIIIKAWQSEGLLHFEIIDDGVGMRAEALEEIMAGRVERSGGSGYAIKNITDRLKAYYGENHSFNIFSRPGIGTRIAIAVRAPCE